MSLELHEGDLYGEDDIAILDDKQERSVSSPDSQGAEAAGVVQDSDSSTDSDFEHSEEQGAPVFRQSGDSTDGSFKAASLSPSPGFPAALAPALGSHESPARPIVMRSIQHQRRRATESQTSGRPPLHTQSMPVHAWKLGTSAPINIPMMAAGPPRRTGEGVKRPAAGGGGHGGGSDSDDARLASTFVPPHLLEQRAEALEAARGGFTFSGVSPSASLKREKLLQRNAILRRTGFIEAPLLPISGLPEVMDPIKESHMEALFAAPSALSAALGSSPAVAGQAAARVAR